MGGSAEDIIALIKLVMRAVQAWSTERVQKPMNKSYCSVIQICVLITSRMVDSLETTSSLDRPWYLRDRLLNDRRVDGCAGVHSGILSEIWLKVVQLQCHHDSVTVLI